MSEPTTDQEAREKAHQQVSETAEVAERLWQAEKDANPPGAPGYGETWDAEPRRDIYRVQAAEVERIVDERFLQALRYAQSMALTAKAYGWEDREWLDMIILLGGDAVLTGKALIATIKADAAAYDAEDPLEPIHNMLAGGGDDE